MEHTQHTQQHRYITDILDKIKNKEISVHSKTFFRLKWLAFTILVFAICVVSIMLCSFILFVIHITGQPQLIDFGVQGLKLAFFIFPWMLFILDIILIILLGSLTRHTSFGYKIPGIYVLLGVLCIIGISGYIVEAKTSFHRNMFMREDRRNLPFVGSMYKNVRRTPPLGYEIYTGQVFAIDEQYVVVDLDIPTSVGTTSRVVLRFNTNIEQEIIPPNVGDTVFVSGKIVNGEIFNAKLKIFPVLPSLR